MRFSKAAAVAAIAAVAEAQRPANTSICDYYTTALLKNNTAANQLTILTLIVNTAVIGNYTKPNIAGVTFPDVMVPGILANGTVNGTTVSLLPYFDGSLASTNDGGSSGVSKNFLDGGGAAPLAMNLAANANATSSNQYMLLTHLYQFFGSALGCSQQGMSGYPSYQGVASMYTVHKYMGLDYAQNTYFIDQVALSAQSFGVAAADITVVGTLLNEYFNVRCAPAVNLMIPASAGAVLESICITSDCPLAANSSCSGYSAVVQPSAANSTNMANGTTTSGSNSTGTSGSGTSSSSGSTTSSGTSTSSTGSSDASTVQVGGFAAGLLALAAMFL